MSSSLLHPKARISVIIDRKKREDPMGLLKAQREGTLSQFLAADLRAMGINPDSVSFGSSKGGTSSPHVSEAGAKESPRAPEREVAPTHAAAHNPNKCPSCHKSVHSMEEINVNSQSWHKNCFSCGVGGSGGCKKVLSKDSYHHIDTVPYCVACYNKLHKTNGAAAVRFGKAAPSDTKPEEIKLTDAALERFKSFENQSKPINTPAAAPTPALPSSPSFSSTHPSARR